MFGVLPTFEGLLSFACSWYVFPLTHLSQKKNVKFNRMRLFNYRALEVDRPKWSSWCQSMSFSLIKSLTLSYEHNHFTMGPKSKIKGEHLMTLQHTAQWRHEGSKVSLQKFDGWKANFIASPLVLFSVETVWLSVAALLYHDCLYTKCSLLSHTLSLTYFFLVVYYTAVALPGLPIYEMFLLPNLFVTWLFSCLYDIVVYSYIFVS